MYIRTIARRNEDGSAVRYVQLAHNVWDPDKRHACAEVVYSFGREDRLDRDALARLVRSISRFLDSDQALPVSAPELCFLGSRSLDGAYVLDALWHELAIDSTIAPVAGTRRVSP